MDEKKQNKPDEVIAPQIAKKEPKEEVTFKLERYSEVETKVREAIEKNDIDLLLLLNELTLARNLEGPLGAKEKKQFAVAHVAFKTDQGAIKRSGVYNTKVMDGEAAEDILIAEDFENKDVLALPRQSSFSDKL